MERTKEFKECINSCISTQGLSEAKIKELRSKQILRPARKPKAPGTFFKAAGEIAESIEAMRSFVSKHIKEYAEEGRLSEQQRDSIESEVGLTLRECKSQLDSLNAQVQGGAEKIGVHPTAHRQGVVLILSESLGRVAAAFDKARSARFQRVLERGAMERRYKAPRPVARPGSGAVAGAVAGSSGGGGGEGGEGAAGGGGEQQHQEQAQADGSQAAILEELGALGDAVRDTESKVMEISQLGAIFSQHVMQQAEQIERLYDDAVAATINVERGNTELKKAIDRRGGSTYYVFIILVTAALALLVLDWANSRG